MKKTDTRTFIGFILGLLVIVAHKKYYRGSLFAALMVLINLLDSKERTMARGRSAKIGKVIADSGGQIAVLYFKQATYRKAKAWQQIKSDSPTKAMSHSKS